MTKQSLHNFFEPKSAAIIGASATPGKLGYIAVNNLLRIGYEGKIYPVNPKGGEVLGLKVYKNVKDIPEIVDVALVLIPAAFVIDVMKDFAKKGVKNVVISTGGFSEVDEKGAEMEKEIVRIAKEAGIRIMGPNTTGVISFPAKFTTTFTNIKELRVGGASYVAQTGNFGSITLQWILSRENFGVSRVIGLGNKCDVDDADVIEYLGEDPVTKSIGMYVEGLKDGRRFIDAAKKVVRKKPILVLKSGRTKAGARAAASHTASIAADDDIVDSALKQAGVIRVKNYGDLVSFSKAFNFQPPPGSNKIGVITPSGGLGVCTSDALESMGLSITTFSEKTIKRLEEITPPLVKVGNPFDIWPAVSNHGVEKCYAVGLEAILDDPNVDGVLAGFMQSPGQTELKNVDFLINIMKKHSNKPVVAYCTGEWTLVEELRKTFETHPEIRVPVYEFPEQASEVLSAMHRYAEAVNRFR
ncbi:MAG: CoA-binding protein [Candidatus Bathyarchaeota archaeon]|nr:CoA-binding protein [Candidatus Bathyarchaeota archaeon]